MEKSLDVVLNSAMGTRMLAFFCTEFQIRGLVLLKHWIDTCLLAYACSATSNW